MRINTPALTEPSLSRELSETGTLNIRRLRDVATYRERGKLGVTDTSRHWLRDHQGFEDCVAIRPSGE